jgi:hypothetical protein
MTWSTSAVAVCRSNDAFSSRVSRATSVSWPAADELRRRADLVALRRFIVAALRRRVLTCSPPALERRFIGSA